MGQYHSRILPKDFTVGVYCSDSPNMNGLEGEMSYLSMVLDIARSMPDIKFKFFGSMRKETTGNIEMCGKIPEDKMTEFINSCSMNLRFTRHDGYPQLPIQFLLCGRKALVSCPDEMKYADKIGFEDLAMTDYEEEKLGMPNREKAKDIIMTKIYDIAKRHWDSQMLSRSAHKHYSELMSEQVFKDTICQYLK
jgi:hypothetical protein